mgnify:CR=1 FL=1
MGDGAAARAYHEATKHSWESVRRRAWFLDRDDQPRPFKVYDVDLPRVELPDPPPTGVPAVAAIGARATPGPAAPDLPALARLLRLGAGVRRTVRFPGGEEIHFRTYASAGALYPVEVYAACGELEGVDAGLYHFDPSAAALVRLREGDPRGHLVRATAGEEAAARAPVVLALTGAFFFAFWISVVIWAFRDIRSRTRDLFAQVLATLLVLLFTPFLGAGLVLYLLLRPKETLAQAYERALEEEALLRDIEQQAACPRCQRPVKEDWQVCPSCRQPLKVVCAYCKRLMAPDWVICPYCAHEPAPPSQRPEAAPTTPPVVAAPTRSLSQ